MALCTLDEVKDYLGITGTNTTANNVIERLCDAVTTLANSYCGRVFESTEHTEYYSACGSNYINLKQSPVTTISGIWDDIYRDWESDSLISSTDYEVLDGIIYLKYDYFSDVYKSIKVIYTAGYTSPTIPEDLKQACIMEVVHLYKKAVDGMDVLGRATGTESLTFAGSSIQTSTRLIWDMYKRLSLC